MKTSQGMLPAYNVQTAVDAEQGLIVAQKVSDEPADNRSLLPMAETAQAALEEPFAIARGCRRRIFQRRAGGKPARVKVFCRTCRPSGE